MRTTEARTHVPVAEDGDVLVARHQARALAREAGFTDGDQTVIATAVSEIARNIVMHAGSGAIDLQVVGDRGRSGLIVVCRDRGPGVPDVDLALRDGYSTSGGLGLGLPGARRLMDEFELTSEPGKGTVVTMRKWRPSP